MDEKEVQNSDTVASAQTPVPESAPVDPEPDSVPSDPMSESPAQEPVQEETPVTDVTPASTQAYEQPIADTSQITTEEQPISEVKEMPVTPITPESTEPIRPPPSAPTPQASDATQTQSLVQQDERGFIKSLLVKAQAKIQFNKQKKLEKIIQLAQKKQDITNNDVQKLLRVSDATATRYLVKLVQQGYLARVGSPRDGKYQFLR